MANLKYVARAPPGKEVEELTSRDVLTILQQRKPTADVKPRKARERRKIIVPKQIVETAKELKGTLEAVLFNGKMEQIKRLPVSELAEKLQKINEVDTVIFDGVITKRLVDIADEKKIKHLIAARVSNSVKQPLNVNLLTFTDIES